MSDPTTSVGDPIAANMIVTIACGLIVMFYAARRYDTPETNRLSTTKSLFFLTGTGYMATSLLLFLTLCEIVLRPGVLPFLGVTGAQDVIAKYAAPPVLAAVILTTMLPNVAVLRTADEWLLRRFQIWGRIPHGVRSLADMLSPEALPLEPPDIEKLNAWITEDGDIPNELAEHIASVPESTSRGILTRVLQLYRQLEKLGSEPSYADAFRSHHEGWLAIRDDLRVFTAQSQAFFLLFDRLRLVEGAAGENAFKQAGEKYREICRKLYRQLTELLAQLLLMVEGSEFRIQIRLRSMGFRLAGRTCPPLPFGPFVFMGVMLIIAILSVIAVVRPAQGGPMPIAITAVLIGLTKTIGVLAAVLPKLRWAAFHPDSRGRLPYLGWLAWAAVATLVAFVFERLSFGILGHSTAAAVDFQTYPLSPLAPTTFALSLAVAILCDVDLHLGDGWFRRVSEGMLCGATMSISIFVCLQLLDIESATAGQTSTWFPFVFSFSIGFVAGFFGPCLYRRARMDGTTTDWDSTRTMEGGEVTVENG
jgi:hypothetical protein